MRITKAQAAALAQELCRLEVDDLLVMGVREDPDRASPRGVLRVSLKDHWSREVVYVDRQGVVSRRACAATLVQIPGQTSFLDG